MYFLGFSELVFCDLGISEMRGHRISIT